MRVISCCIYAFSKVIAFSSSSSSSAFLFHFYGTPISQILVANLAIRRALEVVLMGKGDNERCIFPLTYLQIGDLQSYLSDLSLFLANDSKRVYILVDNRPWLRDLGASGAHFWQLMVTKSRLSPFAITKAHRVRKEGKEVCSGSSTSKPKKFLQWFTVVDVSMLSGKRVLLPVEKLRNSLQLRSELHRTLYGFIVFEIAWTDVRGINYYNELQTDTSLAVEAKIMQRWEFDSIAQASSCISSWFSGTLSEKLLLKEHLDSAAGELFYDAAENFSGPVPIDDGDDDDDNIYNDILSAEDCPVHCLDNDFSIYSERTEQGIEIPHTPPPLSGPYKRRNVMKSFDTGLEVHNYSDEMLAETENCSQCSETSSSVSENGDEVTQYSDVLILVRFADHDLPFKLREVIVPDLRLLTLLEAGLPSWVLFLQSYPVFCHLYRPWMCPLARVLYVLISLATVIIGFYDLYKNVPILKATASRLCGPLFDWIETWEMVSRIKYLGTILFLHNFQRAIKWFLAVTHTTRYFFSVLVQPLVEIFEEVFGFLLPSLNMLFELVEDICSVVWIAIATSCDIVGDLLEFLFSPFWFIFSLAWKIATTILYPIFLILWEIFYAPVRLVLAMSSFVAFICNYSFAILGNVWNFLSSFIQLASSSEAALRSHEISIWRTLWNDLLSRIFRAIKSILYGFVAFFAACNRHRLSIYNLIQEFLRRLFRRCRTSKPADSRDGS
ncbi:hypothetical protein L6164_029097 [Bauhinia variegata]|uniref:Uncharacterized protein n=1 Tax=Bauhinia variegata TaxID=167791 RepID=A0ACB9L886_BAUVA|nr:hypothetical protein L6164_029097 [Bauhinia variegata]